MSIFNNMIRCGLFSGLVSLVWEHVLIFGTKETSTRERDSTYLALNKSLTLQKKNLNQLSKKNVVLSLHRLGFYHYPKPCSSQFANLPQNVFQVVNIFQWAPMFESGCWQMAGPCWSYAADCLKIPVLWLGSVIQPLLTLEFCVRLLLVITTWMLVCVKIREGGFVG